MILTACAGAGIPVAEAPHDDLPAILTGTLLYGTFSLVGAAVRTYALRLEKVR